MIGTILGGRYEIIEVVGSGGMAIVYKAKDKLLDRFVAVKMLREELQHDKEFVERFKAEARSAASLNHPNVVSVFDVGTDNDREYFVMEYIEGITLKEVIDAKKMGWKTACSYGVQIAGAIEHAHRKNIVHRDIKPHNIMITKDKVVKVTDFGIARAVTSSTIVRSGNVIGSVHYFSPEQASGGVVDFKSDIYSMGVVLYEMLTGNVPFDAENPVAIAKMHVDNPVKPPREINPEIPEVVNDIVLKTMKKQPSKRYQRSEDLAADLRRAVVDPESVNVKDGDATQFVPVVKPSVIREEEPKIEVPEVNKEKSKVIITEEKQPKNTAAKVAWIVTLLIFLISVGSVAAILFPTFFGTGTKVEVPDLRGMTIEEAEELCEGKFKIKEEEGDYSDKYAVDEIMKQEPNPGFHKKADEIVVHISRGQKNIELEDYVGQEYRVIKRELESMGLEVVRKEVDDKDYEGGQIVKQSPSEGTVLKAGDTVILYECAGREKITLSDYTGENAEDIQEELEELDITVVIEEVEDSKVKIGNIVKHEPAEGEKVKPGVDTVTLYVSAEIEEEKVVMPDIVGLTRTEAEETIESLGLEVGTVTEIEVENKSLVGTVIKQRIPVGNKVAKGSKISFNVGVSSKAAEEPAEDTDDEKEDKSDDGAMSR